MKVSKNTYLQSFGIIVVILALFRCACPGVTGTDANTTSDHNQECADSIASQTPGMSSCGDSEGSSNRTVSNDVSHSVLPPVADVSAAIFRDMPHPIYSVPGFQECFPDSQSAHLDAASRWGVKSVDDRNEAEQRKSELVYIDASPYYDVDPLRRSIPYLVPRASDLLNDIGRRFFDSLYVKGIPLHKIIVTSALRTRDDVTRLKSHNGNATENSCHLYGTTIDICYNRYVTVSDPQGEPRRQVRNDTLKWVLAEVLRDLRAQERCYVKYEVKQGCFHVTVR